MEKRRPGDMSGQKFLITGTGHCGTGWASRAMNCLGFPCGHEDVYNQFTNTANWMGLRGDSSWFGAFWLDQLPQYTSVSHVIRDPLKVVMSFHLTDFFSDEAIRTSSYQSGIVREFPDILEIQSHAERCVFFYLAMTDRIEAYMNDIGYVRRWKVEELSTNHRTLGEMCLWSTGIHPEDSILRAVINHIPKNINHHMSAKAKSYIPWEEMTQEVLDADSCGHLGARITEYGY